MDNDSFVRLRIEKVSTLQDLVGELGLAVLSITHDASITELKSQKLINKTHRLELLMREVQDRTSALRLVPVGELFRRMERIVRDVSAQTKKPCNLILEGEDTEIDKAVLDRLGDPLMHLLRNAIDHGIRSPEERIANKKQPVGQITLSATQKGREICISVADDGEGLDRQAIIKKARAQGILGENEEPDDETVWSFIFKAGFSTAKEITKLSGRGVGMDVVRTAIQSLHGRITIETQAGKGTRINLHLPLTLAFLDSLIVEERQRLYAIPIDAVNLVFSPTPSEIASASAIGDNIVKWQERWIPLYQLHTIYGEAESAPMQIEKGFENPVEDHGKGIVVVLGTEKDAFGLKFARVIGQQQVIVKPLPGQMETIRGAAGCALLADGQGAIVLDIDTLFTEKR